MDNKHSIPIIDLHCDLLGCVEYGKGKYHFESPETNCSVPQLIEGGVKLQVLAVAAMAGKGTSLLGKTQVELYQNLLERHAEQVESFQKFSIESPKTHFLLAIENASALVEEEEHLDLFFQRFEKYQAIEEILYLSLTWNHENRFGGGNATDKGLKRDGEIVLEYLEGKNIAIDLSHTSDRLAYDVLHFIQKRSLKIPVIASHSNYRAIQDIPRNLPDPIAKEIIRQKGLMGINFVHRFVGKTPKHFIKQIEHALSIGGENALCLGADFYGGIELSQEMCPGKTPTTFFENFSHSGCYPQFTQLLEESFSRDLIHKICHQNVESFLIRLFRNSAHEVV